MQGGEGRTIRRLLPQSTAEMVGRARMWQGSGEKSLDSIFIWDGRFYRIY
jgi:hypothetical protein